MNIGTMAILIFVLGTAGYLKASDPLEVKESWPSSQPKEKPSTLMSDVNFKSISFQGSPSILWERLQGQKSVSFGFAGGLTINQKTTVGLSIHDLASEIKWRNQGQDEVLELNHFGVFIDYSPWSQSIVHPVFSFNLGTGTVKIGEEEENFGSYTPGIDLEVNLSSFARISLGYHLRVIDSLSHSAIADDELGTSNLVFKFKFGSF